MVPGVYLEACWAEDLPSRGAAVLHAAPAGVLSHWTALAVRGLPVPGVVTDAVHVTVPADVPRPRWGGVVSHRSTTVRPYVVDGLRVTGAVRAWCDTAALVTGGDDAVMVGSRLQQGGRRADLADLVAAGDVLLARRPGTVVDVRNQLSLRRGGRGTAVADRAVRLLDGRAESPPESRLRVLLHLAGLPRPAVQHEVSDTAGRLVARLDLAYPTALLAVEYDGEHHRDRRQWRRDLVRREALQQLGWRVLVVVAPELFGDPASVVDRVRTALAHPAA